MTSATTVLKSSLPSKKNDKKMRSTLIRQQINEKLEDSGERERLKELLRAKLVESGWREQLKSKCKEMIENKGLQKITVQQLVEEITPYARSTVPENIKAEILAHLREFIQVQLE